VAHRAGTRETSQPSLKTDGEIVSLHLSQNRQTLLFQKEHKNTKGTAMAFFP
jgi:hypothetical protein